MKLDCNILHLDDDDNDSFFFQHVLENLHFTGNYRRTSSVQETIDYLSGTENFADRRLYPLPDVLVADSALGIGKTTQELMKWIEEHREFSQLVRIVLSGEMSDSQREAWLGRGINCALSKGSNLETLATSVQEILRQCGT